ncbi:MAG: S8 family peptidase [Saprospiraceae bacterium]
MKLGTRFTFLLLLFSQMIQSQTIINGQAYTFDDQDLNGWTSENLSSVNFGNWQWKENGKADGGTYWNDRDSIRSTSLGGAAVYDSDGLFSGGVGNPALPVEVALNSPVLNFQGEPNVYLKFNQYFRNYQTDTRVEVSIDNGTTWTTFNVNDNVNQNVETSSGDYRVIDISSAAGGVGEALVRFVFFGDYYFWILDDVEFWNDDPSPQTFPTRYGDSLTVFGKPFEVDSSNWAYVPKEIVVQFKANTTPLERQLIRDSLGATLKESCVCDRLELWEFGNSSGDTLSGNGNTIGINEIVKSTKSKSNIDGVDVNRYNFNELQNEVPIINSPIDNIPNGIVAPSDNVTLVAILDTGIDYEHPSLLKYIYLNDDELDGNNIDDDDNCQENDPLGWNFVDDNNNIKDDHSHGTHVAGIVVKNFEEQYGDSCEVKIIGYKTHDSYGTSNLFDVTCATYQALEDSVEVINDSWGFYGDSSIILSNAVDTIREHDILIVTASGNDSLDLSMNAQYPACYHAANVLTVGSLDTIIGNNGSLSFINSEFSNYDPICVDILAPGRNISSTVLNDMEATKTGTSMSAPAVTVAAAIAYCSGYKEHSAVKESILVCADKYTSLQDTILDGNVLNYNISCLTPIDELVLKNSNEFSLYPNPAENHIFITSVQEVKEAEIQIFDLAGQIIFSKKIKNWDHFSTEQINVKKWSSGVYFIKIYSGHHYWNYKMIKI